MDTLGLLVEGLQVAVTPTNLVYLTIGVLSGMVIGIIPGLGPAAGIAILLPLTFNVEPVTAVVMLAATYYGTMYGGTITAVFLNTPGDSAAVAATFDGYPMALQGRAGPALVIQAVASFFGGTLGVVLLTLLAPGFSLVARSFGPPEFFMLVLLGMLSLAVLLGRNRRYGLVSALLGLALATVGVDVGSGHSRYTFGSPSLLDGIDFIPVAIGLFGVAELLDSIGRGLHLPGSTEGVAWGGRQKLWPNRQEWRESRGATARGSIVGFLLGVVPGAGATIASLLSYSLEKAISRVPERFGKGAVAGLAAPEAANNAASSGALVPLLTLGIPGSASTAVLLGAFMMWGLRPGPLLMTENPEFAWGLIASMYLGNVMLVVLSIVAIPLFVSLVRIPYRIIAPVVVVLCVVGAFSVNGSVLDTWVMLVAGVLGVFMKRLGFSPAALVVALVLGPLAENTLRQSLVISEGSPAIFVERPIALGIGIFTLLLVLLGPLLMGKGRPRAPASTLPGGTT
jgi:putative tricarboxylic transport membrane protein